MTRPTFDSQSLPRWQDLPDGWERQFKILAAAVNDMPNTCDDRCDSYGHSEACCAAQERWPADKIVELEAKLHALVGEPDHPEGDK